MQLKKWLGQNFLSDDNILRKEVSIAEVKGKTVLEIGPGDGRLTEKILEAGPKKLTAVEKDPEMVAVLKDRFAKEIEAKKLVVVEADFLEFKPRSMKFGAILGNIPYYISSQIIFRLKDFEFSRAVMIIQKEFAEKMVAKPNEENYGRLSVTSQLAFNTKLVHKVPRHLFKPQPKVDSEMISLEPTGTKITPHEEDVIRSLYQHKNQTVRNALKHSGHKDWKIGDVPAVLAERRPRTLTKDECLEIAATV
jgi:16S rRNA (adenine1518-N6/adenine1519-N6)-dimethyltransferase